MTINIAIQKKTSLNANFVKKKFKHPQTLKKHIKEKHPLELQTDNHYVQTDNNNNQQEDNHYVQTDNNNNMNRNMYIYVPVVVMTLLIVLLAIRPDTSAETIQTILILFYKFSEKLLI
ncbi:DNA-directed RNA polymerase III subunit RPC1-like isoform X1 [Centruroides sculpturatus]|uniref:DNA-directed RNA polymerase III subunit RPC1-like isoform X1 n=1 Tax=Centruroides sculpturatus TaxID=218467 RepID=UPI000C6EE559|nr:DNA-directed RNA polymerase III subunit RPC1-like isoform X1 [Centruroides sculpturatus]